MTDLRSRGRGKFTSITSPIPAAGIGEVIEVSFPRPRDRKSVMEHPDYYVLRERLIHFLEFKAHKHHAAETPLATTT